jgi:hypothetical protein
MGLNLPPPPGPPLLRSGHPCNPKFIDSIPYIQVNSEGKHDRNKRYRRAIPDPNKPGCYILADAENHNNLNNNIGGGYRKTMRKYKSKRRTRRHRRTHRK